jgi:hypothetical protein
MKSLLRSRPARTDEAARGQYHETGGGQPTPSRQTGLSLLQGLLVLAIIGVVVTVVLQQLR